MSKDPLFLFRQSVALFSLGKAGQRIKSEKQDAAQYDEIELDEKFDERLVNQLGYLNICSEYADTSSVTQGRFSRDGKLYATVGSSGLGTLWKTENPASMDFCKQATQLRAVNKMCDVDLHPRIGSIPAFAPNIITGCFNGEVFLWTFDPSKAEQKSITIKSHTDRVNSTRFHPGGTAFLTASYDQSWGIWDCMKLKQLSSQKGHLKEIHTMSLHPDGSLIFTGDLGGWGMLWDLRVGKGIFELGTSNSILCSDFHPNGFELAIGGRNNLAEIYDLRRRVAVKTIPAHVKLISDLQYNEDGTLLMTASHDCTVKLWHGRNYTSVEEELEHPTKITSVGVRGGMVACTMIDRKWTMWKNGRADSEQDKGNGMEIKKQQGGERSAGQER